MNFNVSNLNFKSLQNFNKTVPNDNNTERELTHIPTYAGNYYYTSVENQNMNNVAYSKFKQKKMKSYSQNEIIHTDNPKQNISREDTNHHMQLNFASSCSSLNSATNLRQNINTNDNLNQQVYADYDDISDVSVFKLIVKNLENEVREKNDEIKILNRNFKEKITLMEGANKIAFDGLDNKYKLQINNLNQNNKHLLNQIKEENSECKEKFEDIIKKILRDFKNYKQSSISLSCHNEQINNIVFREKDNFNKLQNMYDSKIKEFITFLENPMYNLILEKINFFNLHNLNDIEEVNFDDPILNELKEIQTFLDKLKIKILEIDAKFKFEITKIEMKTENIFNSFKLNKRNKFEELKGVVKKRFSEIENLNTFVEDEKEINNEEYENIVENEMEGNSVNHFLNKRGVSINSNNKSEEIQFTSSLLKNSNSNFGLPLDEYQTFKNQSNMSPEIEISKSRNANLVSENSLNINEMENREGPDNELSSRRKVSTFTSESNNMTILDESSVRKPSKILTKTYKISDFNS